MYIKNNNSKIKNFINLLKKIIYSKPFNVINKIFLTLLFSAGVYFSSYEKWTFWLSIVLWLFVVPDFLVNFLIKLLKKYVIKKK